MSEFPVVTICGSMRFRDEMLLAAQKLSIQGYIVLAPFVTFVGEEQSSASKEMLDRMHFRKIDMSNCIFVVNVDGYIGASTQNEVDYARRGGKLILSLEPIAPPS